MTNVFHYYIDKVWLPIENRWKFFLLYRSVAVDEQLKFFMFLNAMMLCLVMLYSRLIFSVIWVHIHLNIRKKNFRIFPKFWSDILTVTGESCLLHISTQINRMTDGQTFLDWFRIGYRSKKYLVCTTSKCVPIFWRFRYKNIYPKPKLLYLDGYYVPVLFYPSLKVDVLYVNFVKTFARPGRKL